MNVIQGAFNTLKLELKSQIEQQITTRSERLEQLITAKNTAVKIMEDKTNDLSYECDFECDVNVLVMNVCLKYTM